MNFIFGIVNLDGYWKTALNCTESNENKNTVKSLKTNVSVEKLNFKLQANAYQTFK